MIYLNAFIFAGIVCALAQVILDTTKLTPGHITVIFVVVGAFFDVFKGFFFVFCQQVHGALGKGRVVNIEVDDFIGIGRGFGV